MSATRTGLAGQLWVQVAVAMLAGILLGVVAPDIGSQLKILGDLFIALLRMLVAPIIFCTVVHGIAGMNDIRRAGRVALKALAYFEVITTLALVVALVAVNIGQPGAGMNIDPQALDGQAVAAYAISPAHRGIGEFVLQLIPVSLFGALTQPDILQVLFVSILFAFALARIGARGQPVIAMLASVSQVLFRIVHMIMYAAPAAAFGAMAFTVGKFGAQSLLGLATLIIHYYLVCVFFVIVVFGAAAHWAGASLWRLIRYFRDEIAIVAATTSGESVLPRLIEKLPKLGCHESVVGLVVPTGYSFNLDGTCLYLATAVVFLAQATRTPLDLHAQLSVLTVLLLTSKGAAGVTGSSLIVLTATLASLGTVPVASIALILGIHRLLAEAMSFVNLMGNCVATLVISKWERALDESMLRRELGYPTQTRP